MTKEQYLMNLNWYEEEKRILSSIENFFNAYEVDNQLIFKLPLKVEWKVDKKNYIDNLTRLYLKEGSLMVESKQDGIDDSLEDCVYEFLDSLEKELIKRYPEYFEGDKFGFFGESHHIKSFKLFEKLEPIYYSIENFFNEFQKNGEIIFNPYVVLDYDETKGYKGIKVRRMFKEDEIYVEHFTPICGCWRANSTLAFDTIFLEKFEETLSKRDEFIDYFEGRKFNLYENKKIKGFSSFQIARKRTYEEELEETKNLSKTIKNYYNFYKEKEGESIEFDPPLIIPSRREGVFWKINSISENQLEESKISYNICDCAPDFLEKLVEELQKLHPEFFEGDKFGFFESVTWIDEEYYDEIKNFVKNFGNGRVKFDPPLKFDYKDGFEHYDEVLYEIFIEKDMMFEVTIDENEQIISKMERYSDSYLLPLLNSIKERYPEYFEADKFGFL